MSLRAFPDLTQGTQATLIIITPDDVDLTAATITCKMYSTAGNKKIDGLAGTVASKHEAAYTLSPSDCNTPASYEVEMKAVLASARVWISEKFALKITPNL